MLCLVCVVLQKVVTVAMATVVEVCVLIMPDCIRCEVLYAYFLVITYKYMQRYLADMSVSPSLWRRECCMRWVNLICFLLFLFYHDAGRIAQTRLHSVWQKMDMKRREYLLLIIEFKVLDTVPRAMIWSYVNEKIKDCKQTCCRCDIMCFIVTAVRCMV